MEGDWADEKATQIVKAIEHGDEKHRQWLHEVGHAGIAQSLREAFESGMKFKSIDRSRVSIHGSDGCSNCEDGRITVYAGSRYCLQCQLKTKQS